MPVEENTTVDSDGFSGQVDNAAVGDEEKNFTDPIFESELAQFKLRLAQTIEPVMSSSMPSQLEPLGNPLKRKKMLPNISNKWLNLVK